MSNEFDDIQDILADILDEKKPAPVKKEPETTVQQAHAVATFEEPDVFLDFSGELPDAAVITTTIASDGKRKMKATPLPAAGVLPGSEEDIDSLFEEATAPEVIFTDSKKDEGATGIPIPTFTTEDLMESFDIRKFASLVTLNTARWHAKVKDRQASKNAAAATGAKEEAFESRKRLLAGADEKLLRIHKAIDAARIRHYELTVPWSSTGVDDTGRRTGARLLPNTLFFEYTQEMAKFRKEMEQALADFIPAYPSLIQEAKKNLKGSFNAAEYPNPSSIGQHFNLSFDFQPIPKGTDFKGLPQQQLTALAKHLNNSTQKMLENAMQENWVRLRTVIEHMAKKLSDPAARFHSTLVENVREIVRLLTHLNVTNDQKIEKVRAYAEKHLCAHDAAELKKNPALRTKVAAHAQSALSMMDKV